MLCAWGHGSLGRVAKSFAVRRVMYGDKKAQLELDVEEYSAWLEDGGVATGEALTTHV